MAGLMPADPPGGHLHGTDNQGFAEAVAQTCGWDVHPAATDVPFAWSIHAVELRSPDPRGASALNIATLGCPAGALPMTAAHPSDVVIVMPLGGSLKLEVAGETAIVERSQALVCQSRALGGLAPVTDGALMGFGVIRLNFRSLEHILFAPLHLPIDPDLQMRATIDARAVETGGLYAMGLGLCSEGFIGQGRRLSPRLQRSLIDGLALMVLETVPHRYSDQMLRPSVGPVPSYVRVAREFMQAAEGTLFSMADISARAGVSVRTLELGFRTYLNITPAAYLRTVRLQRAHAILKAGDDRRTVAEIGKSCGLPHAGRFAEYYVQLFGETPSETRRRGEAAAV